MMNISSWLFSSMVTWLLFGFWGFFGKLASRTVTWQNLVILSNIGWFTILPLVMVIFRQYLKFEANQINYYWAILSGIAGSAGMIFFYIALTRGEASRVVAITAAYPLVVVVLAVIFLREPVTTLKIIGVILTMVGVYFLSI
jgi:uncharacterized membrane protein